MSMVSGKRFFILGVFLVLAVLFTTCDMVSLGETVNTNVPVIGNADEGEKPGAVLSGDNNEIELEIIQDYGFSFYGNRISAKRRC